MVNVVIRTGVVFVLILKLKQTDLYIFYRNVRNVSTKQTELFDNTYSKEFQIVCLTEMLLNDVCFDHKLFPDCLTPSGLIRSVALNIVLLF